MKFVLSLATLALATQAIQLGADADADANATLDLELAAETEAATETSTEITAEAEAKAEVEAEAETSVEAGASAPYNGPIVPSDYATAVHQYNIHAPFTDQECYQKQVDIYSDQIIAIEALRLEVLQLTQRITQAEYDY